MVLVAVVGGHPVAGWSGSWRDNPFVVGPRPRRKLPYRETNAETLREKYGPNMILFWSIYAALPKKSIRFRKLFMEKVYLYPDAEHPHQDKVLSCPGMCMGQACRGTEAADTGSLCVPRGGGEAYVSGRTPPPPPLRTLPQPTPMMTDEKQSTLSASGNIFCLRRPGHNLPLIPPPPNFPLCGEWQKEAVPPDLCVFKMLRMKRGIQKGPPNPNF